MFNQKKSVNADNYKSFQDVMYNAVCTTVVGALESILKMEYKRNDNGKEVIDYELTARMMKANARIALDLISKIQDDKGEV